MSDSTTNQTTAPDAGRSDITLCIAGGNTFSNDVLANFIESKIGIKCYSIGHAELHRLWEPAAVLPDILFLDCASMGGTRVCKHADFDQRLQNHPVKVICFNVNPKAKLGRIALKRGIHGVIYDHQPAEMYAQAALAVLNDELWFPRKTLERHLMAGDDQPAAPVQGSSSLTRREIEILQLLAAGKRNQDIANALCISPHTVKTHIYNLFKKIDVGNRFQATQWLLKQR